MKTLKSIDINIIITVVVIVLFIVGISQADFSNHYQNIICK